MQVTMDGAPGDCGVCAAACYRCPCAEALILDIGSSPVTTTDLIHCRELLRKLAKSEDVEILVQHEVLRLQVAVHNVHLL